MADPRPHNGTVDDQLEELVQRAREKALERVRSACQEAVTVPPLRHARAWLDVHGQAVTIEHRHALETPAQHFRCDQAADAGADDDGASRVRRG